MLFADDTYLRRPWCVHELRLITAAWRAGVVDGLASVVVALPAGGDLSAVTAQLPPPLAAASWPTVAQPDALRATVQAALGRAGLTLRERLQTTNDDTLARMLVGADQPLAWAVASPPPARAMPALWLLDDAPAPRGEALIGRAADLWRMVHECVTARAFTPARRVVLRGLGGCGKSLLASEFVARHGRRFFPSGVVWIDAEAGQSGLLHRYARLWQLLAPGEDAPGAGLEAASERAACLADALRDRLTVGSAAGDLLWVIDGLPEPALGVASSLADWCPALQHVSVLATTRRADSLRGADATLALGPLAPLDAVTMLTRPPVNKHWMQAHEWQAVAHWAGELPLVLSVLRESLVDGAISVESLRKAPGAEPAAESERLMDGLRGEIDDISLRGAAEAFELSWRALAGDPDLLAAATRIALLAPVPLGEALLGAVAEQPLIGKLARRSWLQPAEDVRASQRAHAMHRVPASVLRMKARDATRLFEGLLDAFSSLVERGDEAAMDRLDLHVDVAVGHLLRLGLAADPPLMHAATHFVCAAAHLAASEQRGLRFMAGAVARSFGIADLFVAELRRSLTDDEAALAGIPHALAALPGCSTAIEWMRQLLADPRPGIRRAALLNASRLDAQALRGPILTAVLATPGSQALGLDGVLGDPAQLEAVWPTLWAALQQGDALARAQAAQLIGRALALHGRTVGAGGLDGSTIARQLAQRAVEDDEPAVRGAAAQAAGTWFDPTAWQVLRDAAGHVDPAPRSRGLAAAAAYLRAATAPPMPRAATARRSDDGALVVDVQLGQPTPLLPDGTTATLVDWVLTLPDPDSSAAAAILGSLRQGLHDCSPWVYARLEQRDAAAALRLADALVRVRPDFVNAWWWRGLARVQLGDDDGAGTDFEQVLRLSPQFGDAVSELGGALLRSGQRDCEAGRFDLAAPKLLRAAELLPDRLEAHHLASLSLYNLQRYDEAADAASRAIALGPNVGETWFFRAVAHYAAGHVDDAMADLRRAAELSPTDERISGFKSQLEDWLRNRAAAAPAGNTSAGS